MSHVDVKVQFALSPARVWRGGEEEEGEGGIEEGGCMWGKSLVYVISLS